MANDILTAQVNRIRQKAETLAIHRYPCLSIEEVEAFEQRYQARLPEGYRQFLLTVGNGGDGPPYPELGLAPLAESNSQHFEGWGNFLHLAKPFPFDGPWSDLDEPEMEDQELTDEEIEDYQDRWHEKYVELRYGTIFLGSEGCGRFFFLVVNGPFQDTVWYAGDSVLETGGLMPVLPYADFLTWYELWLISRSLPDDNEHVFAQGIATNIRFPDGETERLDLVVYKCDWLDLAKNHSSRESPYGSILTLPPNAVLQIVRNASDMAGKTAYLHKNGVTDVIIFNIVSGQITHSIRDTGETIYQSPSSIPLTCGCTCLV